jgi:hypothetical protein
MTAAANYRATCQGCSSITVKQYISVRIVRSESSSKLPAVAALELLAPAGEWQQHQWQQHWREHEWRERAWPSIFTRQPSVTRVPQLTGYAPARPVVLGPMLEQCGRFRGLPRSTSVRNQTHGFYYKFRKARPIQTGRLWFCPRVAICTDRRVTPTARLFVHVLVGAPPSP